MYYILHAARSPDFPGIYFPKKGCYVLFLIFFPQLSFRLQIFFSVSSLVFSSQQVNKNKEKQSAVPLAQ